MVNCGCWLRGICWEGKGVNAVGGERVRRLERGGIGGLGDSRGKRMDGREFGF